MAHLALYREWRPQTLAEVVGQAHVVRTLKNALAAGTTAHAYLFAGPRGTGKTSVARILAKAMNCLEPQAGEPCNRCQLCLDIARGACLDVLEIDAASNRGIDEIRDLREKVRYAPAQARHKVYIIDEVHMLTVEAFNALLKTLEEPPAHVVFVLATTEAHRVPATILSRCQRFDFHRLSPADVLRRLEEVRARHGLAVDDQALRLLARHADGSLRDALGLLDQCLSFAGQKVGEAEVLEVLGSAPSQRFTELCRCLADGDPAGALRLLEELVSAGHDVAQMARDWLAYARSLLLAGLESVERPSATYLAEYSPEEVKELRAQALRLGRARLQTLLEGLAQAEAQMKWSAQPRLLLELLVLRLCPAQEAPVPLEQPARAPVAAERPAKAAVPVEKPVAAAAAVEETARAAVPTEKPVAVAAPAEKPVEAAVPARPVEKPAEAALPVEKPVEETAPQAPAPTAPAAGLTREMVIAAWPRVREMVREASKPLAAHLNHAEPLAVNGSVVVLGVKSEVYRDWMIREAPRLIMDGVLSKALGRKVRMDVRVAETERATAPAPPARAAVAPEGAAAPALQPPSAAPDAPPDALPAVPGESLPSRPTAPVSPSTPTGQAGAGPAGQTAPAPRRGRRAAAALEADREAALALDILGGRLVDPGEAGSGGQGSGGR